MAKTTDYVKQTPAIDTWLESYINKYEKKLAEPIDYDRFKSLDATKIPENFIDVINSFIHHVQVIGNSKIKVRCTENLVLRYAAYRINEMMKMGDEDDINNYTSIITCTREIRKKIPRYVKENADFISVVGKSTKKLHADDITHGMYVNIADTLGVSIVSVVRFALHIILNESVWINKEYDYVKSEYLVDWDDRSYTIIKDRIETRLREVNRAIEQVYNRYLSSTHRYINGETVNIELMKSDGVWLTTIKKEGIFDGTIDDFESVTLKRELIESGHDEIEAHKLMCVEECNSDLQSVMDMFNLLHKQVDIQKIKIEELYESQKQVNQALQSNQALCDSCNVKIEALNEQLDAVNILKTDMQKMNEKLELPSESCFNRIKKLVFKCQK